MDRNLALEVVRVTEAAALESARFMGRGDATAVDRAASAAMRRAFHAMDVDATVVVGEGREGEVEGLYVGERIGAGGAPIDVALDALEGATVCATGGANALSIILISERGRILSCPETYMDKLAIGPGYAPGIVSLARTPTENVKALAKAKGVQPDENIACALDRPRHTKLIP